MSGIDHKIFIAPDTRTNYDGWTDEINYKFRELIKSQRERLKKFDEIALSSGCNCDKCKEVRESEIKTGAEELDKIFEKNVDEFNKRADESIKAEYVTDEKKDIKIVRLKADDPEKLKQLTQPEFLNYAGVGTITDALRKCANVDGVGIFEPGYFATR